jgi:tRNA modification GTPase
MSETIAAISTAMMPAGIGIVRISGDGALEAARKIWQGKNGKTIEKMAPYTAALGIVSDGNEKIDECVALVYHAPKSYTGEDVVELSCHGGVYIINRVLEAAISAGARLARPGEFTKRAFLNGKLDLTRAEAVMDLIGAQGETAVRAAFLQHEGVLYKKIENIKQQIVEISADITAWIDFPDEEVPSLEPETLQRNLEKELAELSKLSKSYGHGRIIKEGVETAIVGRPNVGKSTLMNALTGYEKSIVTAVPGTTRDVVEDSVNFAGLMLKLWDTAGLRETEDPVEIIGVERAKGRLEAAQLILAVFDGSKPIGDIDVKILNSIKGRQAIAVINKCDLPIMIDTQYITNIIQHTVYISAEKGDGLDRLEEEIRKMTDMAGFDPGAALLANGRQLDCVKAAIDGLKAATEAVSSGITLDAVSVGVEDAIGALCELTGERASEEIIDRVFSKFCIGK